MHDNGCYSYYDSIHTNVQMYLNTVDPSRLFSTLSSHYPASTQHVGHFLHSLVSSLLFLSHRSYLLPHLLPYKPAMDIHGFRQQSNNTLQRLVKMSFVPAGFWERFIARMLISLKEMDLQVPAPASVVLVNAVLDVFSTYACVQMCAFLVLFAKSFEPRKNTRHQRSKNSLVYNFAAATQHKNRCSTFRVRRSQTIYWKEGLLVTFDGGYLRLVQSTR